GRGDPQEISMHAYLKQYVKAVTALLEDGGSPTEVLQNARRVMERRGHGRLYPLLLAALERTLPNVGRARRATLVVAKEADAAKAKKALDEGESYEIRIDPSIIGGFITTKDFVQRDQSYKSKLLTWFYQSVERSS